MGVCIAMVLGNGKQSGIGMALGTLSMEVVDWGCRQE